MRAAPPSRDDSRVTMLARCPATGLLVDTGARWPAVMNGGLAYTLLAGGVGISQCPACGNAHGREGLDLSVADASDTDCPT
jgi:hypothetical protein